MKRYIYDILPESEYQLPEWVAFRDGILLLISFYFIENNKISTDSIYFRKIFRLFSCTALHRIHTICLTK